jgi:hypothetical protein
MTGRTEPPVTTEAGDALRQISEIRRLVEASGRFTLLSAGASLGAGVAALGGATLTHGVLLGCGEVAELTPAAAVHVGEIWLGVLGLALAGLLLGTLHRARLGGEPVLGRLLRRIAFGLAPSFMVALALTVALAGRGQYDLVAPVWILSYGAAAVTAGLFSRRSVQVLGCAFLALGLISLTWGTEQPALWLGLSFGGLHLGHGLWLWRHRVA